MIIIIGAGPTGLSLAIKFRNAGIKQALVVYDPRAGIYTRPGHLQRNVFRRAESTLGKSLWSDSYGHIKDLERALYTEAKSLGIAIENKRFVKLVQDANMPGVIVADDKGIEERVTADYVFDCSGQRRIVVNDVNRICPESPLKLIDFADVPVPNHFLAYVQMDEFQIDQLENAFITYIHSPNNVEALHFSRSMNTLRRLGWNHSVFPRCYGARFGKADNKVCLYLQAPDHLTEDNYNHWVRAVIACYADVDYEHVKPSKKYLNKPRFISFSLKAQALAEPGYKGQGLPIVLALGDAQIDSDYYLAVGILNALKGIDLLFEHMKIGDDKIENFDLHKYSGSLRTLYHEHKIYAKSSAEQTKEFFSKGFKTAQLKLQQAIKLTSDAEEKITFNVYLREIKAQKCYERGLNLYTECYDFNDEMKLISLSMNTVFSKFIALHRDLLDAFNGLPASFLTERENTKKYLAVLAASWDLIGSDFFRTHSQAQAMDAYSKAMQIYDLPSFEEKYSLKKIITYSHLIVIYRKRQLYSEAILAAQKALVIYEKIKLESDIPSGVPQKIIYDLLKALCQQADEFLLKESVLPASKSIQEAKSLMLSYRALLGSHMISRLSAKLNELDTRSNGFLNSSDSKNDVSSGLQKFSVFTDSKSEIRKEKHNQTKSHHCTIS